MTLFEYLGSPDLTIALINLIGGVMIGYLLWGKP
jgi:hypothetical protein